MSSHDRDAANAILSAAFDGLNPSVIVERVLALAPDMCWLALDGDIAVAIVCAIQYGPIAYIGPMGVTPEYQGKGIGRCLLQHLIDSLEACGCTTMMLDATDAGEPLYRRCGFVETARTFDMVRAPGPGVSPLPGMDGMDHTLALDRQLYTVDREPTFRRLVEQEQAALFSNNAAYLIAQNRVLGPFAALDAKSAEELLDAALALGAVAGRVLAPAENSDAARLLMSRGFRIEREVKHMRRGRPVAIRRDLIYGLASFALG
ncbi:MAG TPA: GNAT family N-acetyltransferase [Bryobacteraceae bacterium]